ncbi:hypothetical protein DNTS_034983 [Danionella cerebrum]|uniref:Uncharacterized protein n=1 Tax=Danionella cerebrum TaxID=2873325 RepID=A0A553MTB0_9TELE|nr:hypothetical protein DNTS_034983 [Danionella translucida]
MRSSAPVRRMSLPSSSTPRPEHPARAGPSCGHVERTAECNSLTERERGLVESDRGMDICTAGARKRADDSGSCSSDGWRKGGRNDSSEHVESHMAITGPSVSLLILLACVRKLLRKLPTLSGLKQHASTGG